MVKSELPVPTTFIEPLSLFLSTDIFTNRYSYEVKNQNIKLTLVNFYTPSYSMRILTNY